jgi:hypothetical protein
MVLILVILHIMIIYLTIYSLPMQVPLDTRPHKLEDQHADRPLGPIHFLHTAPCAVFSDQVSTEQSHITECITYLLIYNLGAFVVNGLFL